MKINSIARNWEGGQCMRKMKKIPVGIESFPEMRRQDFYYIDKTEMIRDLLYSWGQVNLFTRPRRFGKSLNMSMLKAFLRLTRMNLYLKA